MIPNYCQCYQRCRNFVSTKPWLSKKYQFVFEIPFSTSNWVEILHQWHDFAPQLQGFVQPVFGRKDIFVSEYQFFTKHPASQKFWNRAIGLVHFTFFEGPNSIKGFGVVNLGVAKKLKNDKVTFRLSMPDLLQSFSVHTHNGGMTPIAFDINTVSNWRDETAFYRVIKLTYSRSLGKNTRNLKYEAKNEEREIVRWS